MMPEKVGRLLLDCATDEHDRCPGSVIWADGTRQMVCTCECHKKEKMELMPV